MSELHKRCSECSKPIAPNRKTCGDKCRKARSIRLKREAGDLPPKQDTRFNAALPPHLKRLQEAVNNEIDDSVHEVLNEELRPVVREAITEDVLRSIQAAVTLVPSALAAIQDDLQSDDRSLRHRAAQLLLKYTLGHPAMVPPEEADNQRQIIVNFGGMARPEHVTAQVEQVTVTPDDIEEIDEELRECDKCHEDKPLDEFVESSDRCKVCFEAQLAKQQELLDATA